MQNNGLRQIVVKTILALIRTLIEPGVLTVSEYSVIAKNLTHLAKHGELAPAVPHKLITPQEVAELLSISYSQFRQLEKEGAFEKHFKRRVIGNKTVRYYLPDIVSFMATQENAEVNTMKN